MADKKKASTITPDMDIAGLVDLNDIREYREQCRGEIQHMLGQVENEGNREFTADEADRIDFLNERFEQSDRLVERREMANRVAAREYHERHGTDVVRSMQKRHREEFGRSPNRANLGRGEQDVAFRTWTKVQGGHQPTEDEIRSASRAGINLMARSLDIPVEPGFWSSGQKRLEQLEKRNNDIGTAGDGQETVAEGFMNELEMAMQYASGMRQACRIVRTAGGNDLQWPVTNDTSQAAAIVSEAGTLNAVDIPFDQVTYSAYKYATRVDVTSELLQDSAFNFASIVGQAMGERFGRGMNAGYSTGSGSSQPSGAFDSSVGFSDGTNTFSIGNIVSQFYGDLLDLFHAVDIMYRSQPGCAWMMHDLFAADVRTIESANGQLIWQENARVGMPASMLGKPIWINNDIDDGQSASERPIAFGDWSKYIIRDAGTFRMARSEHFRFAEDVVCFAGYWRTDGKKVSTATATYDPVLLGVTAA